jgi:DNA-binding NarL/FixJ family response regulator
MRSLGAKGRSGPRAAGLLTRRETEILRLLADGLSNREIAERLFISPKTVEHHLSRIYGKLGMSTRAEAAAYAARHLGSE